MSLQLEVVALRPVPVKGGIGKQVKTLKIVSLSVSNNWISMEFVSDDGLQGLLLAKSRSHTRILSPSMCRACCAGVVLSTAFSSAKPSNAIVSLLRSI